MSRTSSRLALGLCTLAIALPLAACQSSSDTTSSNVSSADLQDDVTGYLGDPKPQSVSCPDTLKPEVGQTTECAVTVSDRQSMQVKLTVTKVSDDHKDLTYDFVRSYSPDQLAGQVQGWTEQQQQPVSSVACDSGLQGTKTAPTTYCNMTAADGQQTRVLVTQTFSASGGPDLDFEALAPAAKGR